MCTEQTKQTAENCFWLVGPHQHPVTYVSHMHFSQKLSAQRNQLRDEDDAHTHSLDDSYQVLEDGLSAFVGDHCSRDVAENVGTTGVDCVQVAGRMGTKGTR